MIKSEKQKNRTLESINKFKLELSKLLESSTMEKDFKETYKNSYEIMINQLEKEVAEYEELKQGKFELPKDVTFIELLKNLTKIRISKGLSQQDLAKLVGISRQQLNRYEEHDYQNVSVEKINSILQSLNIYLDLKIAA